MGAPHIAVSLGARRKPARQAGFYARMRCGLTDLSGRKYRSLGVVWCRMCLSHTSLGRMAVRIGRMDMETKDGRPEFSLGPIRGDKDEKPALFALDGSRVPDKIRKLSRRDFLRLCLLGSAAVVTEACLGSTTASTPTPCPTHVPTLADQVLTHTDCEDIVLNPEYNVNSLVFSPDGKMLALALLYSVQLWDVAKGQRVEAFASGHTHFVNSIAFSPDGKTLASGSSDRTVLLWDVAGGELRSQMKGHGGDGVSAVAFSPDGGTLASAGYDKILILWDVPSGQQIQKLEGSGDAVTSVAFSPDGKLLASGSYDRTVRLWDVASHQLVNILKGHTGDVTSVAFSPDGKLLASGSRDKTVRLWDTATDQPAGTLKGHTETVISIAFSPDGRLLASGSMGFLGNKGPLLLWEVPAGRLLANLKGHPYGVKSVAFSPDGKWLATSGAMSDATVRLWGAGVYSCFFDPAVTPKNQKVNTFTLVDREGIQRTYAQPADQALPAGAVCNCNSVAGEWVKSEPGGSSGGTGGCTCQYVGVCTCDQVCVCMAV
jgi:hypothetical protein